MHLTTVISKSAKDALDKLVKDALNRFGYSLWRSSCIWTRCANIFPGRFSLNGTVANGVNDALNGAAQIVRDMGNIRKNWTQRNTHCNLQCSLSTFDAVWFLLILEYRINMTNNEMQMCKHNKGTKAASCKKK